MPHLVLGHGLIHRFKMRVLTFSPACTCQVGPRISVTAVWSSAICSHLLVLPSCWYSLNGGMFLEWEGGEKTPGKDNKGGGAWTQQKSHV